MNNAMAVEPNSVSTQTGSAWTATQINVLPQRHRRYGEATAGQGANEIDVSLSDELAWHVDRGDNKKSATVVMEPS